MRAQTVEHRRRGGGIRAAHQACQTGDLRLERAHGMIGGVERRLGFAFGHSGARQIGFGQFHSAFRVAQCDLGFGFGILGLAQVKQVDARIFEAGHLGAQARYLCGQVFLAARLGGGAFFGGPAAGTQFGETLLRVVRGTLGICEMGPGCLKCSAGISLTAGRERCILLRQGGKLFLGLCERCGGFLARRRLAVEVDRQAQRFGFEPGMRLGSNPPLGFEFRQRDAGLAKPRGGVHFCFAQRREAVAGFNSLLLAHRIFAGEVFHLALERIELRARGFCREARLHPAQVRNQGLKRLDFFGQFAVTARLGSLPLEAAELAFDLGRDLSETLEVGFGAVEFQFGLVAAAVQAGDTRGFFKDPPTVLRLGADQFRNLSLPDKGRGVRAGGGVGEQQLDVLAAHGAPVDAIAGACAAAQFTLDLKLVCAVELRRRCPLRVVEHEDYLGRLPRRTAVRAVEDQVVHLAAAHGLGRVGAHRPAQGFQQV